MSLFIRVDRIEAEGAGTLVRVRDLVAQLGEDRSGIFTCQNPAQIFMSVFRCRGEWFLQADVEGLLLNNGALHSGEGQLLTSGDQVVFEGRSYHFFPSGIEEEILAVSQKRRE